MSVIYSTQCQDCIAYLETVPDKSVDIIFIDPPYNTKNSKDKTVKYDRNKDFTNKNWTNFYSDWDNVDHYYAWTLKYARHCRRVLKPKGSIFICGSFHNIPETALAFQKAGFYTIQWVQWCLPNAFPNLSCTKMTNANQTIIWARPEEKITHYYDKVAAKKYNDGVNLKDYWIIPKESQRKSKEKPWLDHPSKKPVSLVERAIDIALPKVDNGCILDFFAGSGSTGEAVYNITERHNLNLKCAQVDKDETYVNGILARIAVLQSNNATIPL